MIIDILPENLRRDCDSQSARFIEFYYLWIQCGCQGHFQGPILDMTWRFLVRSEIDADGVVHSSVWVEEKRRTLSGPAAFWNFPRPFGATKRHPSLWFAEIIQGLTDNAEQADQ